MCNLVFTLIYSLVILVGVQRIYEMCGDSCIVNAVQMIWHRDSSGKEELILRLWAAATIQNNESSGIRIMIPGPR